PVEKDKSDLEAAMDRAKIRQFDEVIVYGALGGRLDHTMANLQMCARFAESGMGVTFVADDYAIRIVVGPDVYELPLLEEGTVSVFAATNEAYGVIERGMKYSIDDETLTNRTTRGLSNELQGVEAAVAVEEGTLFVFRPLA
ncbi:MAG: thiamine diphosphokinase, partial [Eggerthellaceae bacterium]|nr:thiamine diphosphokinase [Eggerthellaceae bacterium]